MWPHLKLKHTCMKTHTCTWTKLFCTWQWWLWSQGLTVCIVWQIQCFATDLSMWPFRGGGSCKPLPEPPLPFTWPLLIQIGIQIPFQIVSIPFTWHNVLLWWQCWYCVVNDVIVTLSSVKWQIWRQWWWWCFTSAYYGSKAIEEFQDGKKSLSLLFHLHPLPLQFPVSSPGFLLCWRLSIYNIYGSIFCMTDFCNLLSFLWWVCHHLVERELYCHCLQMVAQGLCCHFLQVLGLYCHCLALICC